MKNKIPIVYVYIYSKIKKLRRIYICKSNLYELINRIIIKKGGFPRLLTKYIIEDLENFNLLERVNYKEYKIMDNSCDKYLNKLFLYP